MNNGKVLEFLKSHWRTLLLSFALFAGIFCGIWACSKSAPISVDANRNRVTISISKTK